MKQEEKELGNCVSIDIDMTVPEKMKFTNMDIKQLMILTGTNGVGKSFVMKLIWLLSTQANNIVAAAAHKMTYPSEQTFDFLINNTFSDNDLTGTVSLLFKYGNFIKVELDNGKCTNLVASFEEDTVPSSSPVYMSKETRLLDDIIKYMKFKKLLGISKGFPTDKDHLKKLLEMNKIYDIMFMEKQLLGFETKINTASLEQFNDMFKKFDEKVILTDLRVDYDVSEIYYTIDGEKEKSVRTLGAGHQALFNMFFANILT